MSKTLGRILIFLSIIALILGGLAATRYFLNNKNLRNKFPKIAEIAEKIETPGPLKGPFASTRAKVLSASEIIKWTNYYRTQNVVASLSENVLLEDAATQKVTDMFARQYFEHTDPTGTHTAAILVKNEGYQYKIVGENLALGDFKDEKDLVDAWMASPGHRANILNTEYKEIGVASMLSQFDGRTTWISVQIFATRAPNCTLPSSQLKSEIETKQATYNQNLALYQEGSLLVNQGNAKIQQGNEIYKETHDVSQAQPYWTEGQNLQAQGQQKISQAGDLNAQAQELQVLINQYNAQVQNYNTCISK